MHERVIVFLFFFFFFLGKQPIENKPYFYQGFPLTKNSFSLTNFFVLPNIEKCEKLFL